MSTFLTLDGVMQAPGGPEEDADNGFAYGGWSVNYWDQRMGEVMGEATGRPFAMVLGRRTYDIFAAHWPHAGEEEGTGTFNEATKYVASHARPTPGVEQLGSDRGRRRRGHRGSSRLRRVPSGRFRDREVLVQRDAPFGADRPQVPERALLEFVDPVGGQLFEEPPLAV